jgi:hypothetical protein
MTPPMDGDTYPDVDHQAPMFDLGVLFVHGIGRQGTGETLVHFGDPLLRWIDEWFTLGTREEEVARAEAAAGKKLGNFTDEERKSLAVTLRASSSGGWVAVGKANVTGEERTPAHAEVELGVLRDGKRQQPNHWLLAESRWADAFVAPTFRDLAFWGLVVYPRTNALHYGQQFRRLWGRASSWSPRVGFGSGSGAQQHHNLGPEAPGVQQVPVSSGEKSNAVPGDAARASDSISSERSASAIGSRTIASRSSLSWNEVWQRKYVQPFSEAVSWARNINPLAFVRAAISTPVFLVGSVVVSIVVVVALLLLLALAIPPIPSVRKVLLRIQQQLANSVGDCYILVASPIQKAAIVSHVRRDLEWLLERGCRKIAVVAHSQGAAVAFETLATGVLKGRSADDTMLITFGSGLGKLREVEHAIKLRKAREGWLPILGLVLLVTSLEFAGAINWAPFVGTSKIVAVYSAMFGFLFWIGGLSTSAWGNRPEPERFLPREQFSSDIEWHDYYASEDPVSNGPMFDQDPGFLTSHEVYNRAALWSDHTTYWLNRDEFVPKVVGDLAAFSNLPLLESRVDDKERVATAARRRGWRVHWLAGARIVGGVVTAGIVVTRWDALPKWGAALLCRVPAAEKILRWIGGEALADGQLATDPVAQRVAGIALVVVIVAAAYHVLYGIWQIWTWRDTRVLLRRGNYGWEVPYWMFVLTTMALADAGLLVCLDWLGENAPREVTEGMDWKYLLCPGFFGGLGVLVVRLLKGEAWFGNRPDSTGISLTSTLLQSCAATLVLAPLMALVLIIGRGVEWVKLGALAGLIVLAVVLTVRGGLLILPERQRWNRPG